MSQRIAQVLAEPLLAAREAIERGARAVGYVGADVPVEVILAANATPVRLVGRPDERTPHADRYLEDSFTPEVRSIAEQWLTGALDVLDAVVFSRSDDSAQRLYYYFCELQRLRLCAGPKPLLFDLASIDRERSFVHTIASTRRLAVELEAEMSALPAAIHRVDERVMVLARLASARLDPKPLPGPLVYRLLRAAQCDWSRELDVALESAIGAERGVPGRRLMLIGSAPPDERLHEIVEANGAQVVAEVTETQAPAAPSSAAFADPLESVADRAYRTIQAARALLAAPEAVVERARAVGAQGAVVWLIVEDTGLAWEAPRIARGLEGAGVPALLLTQQSWTSDRETLRRIGEFARTLERTP